MMTREDIYDLYQQGSNTVADLILILLEQNPNLVARIKQLRDLRIMKVHQKISNCF